MSVTRWGSSTGPAAQHSYEVVVAAVTAALDPADLDAAWQRGAAMSLGLAPRAWIVIVVTPS